MNTQVISSTPYRNYRTLWAARLVFVVAVSLLSVGSLLPRDYIPPHPFQDKVLHFAGYAIVAGLAMLGIRRPHRQVACIIGLTLLGISLEFVQMFVPGRSFELWDMAANGCGVFFAYQIMRILLNG